MTSPRYPALAGRTAVVTGAASGMGAATARVLAANGARVALLSRRPAVLKDLAADIGDLALAVPTDIADIDAVQAAAGTVHAAFGPVDLVVNAAGVMLPNPVTDGRADEWQRMVDTNVNGLLHVVRAFTDDLISAAARGRLADLVVVSSVAAHLPTAQYAVYNATKAATSHLAASLRAEFSPVEVRVTTVEPGLTRSELGSHIGNATLAAELGGFFDSLRGLDPGDIADVIAYTTALPANVSLKQVVVVPTRQP